METTDIIEQKKQDEIKSQILSQIELLKKRHEVVKGDMIKILEASKTLDIQYKELEEELYGIESEYIEMMKNLI